MLSLFQLGGDSLGNIIWFVFFMVFMMFYPRIMIIQMVWRLEQSAQMLEGLTVKGKKIVSRKISSNPSGDLRESVNNFLEFFVIEPVNLDPYGIVKKIEHVSILAEKRFKYFVSQVAPKMNEEEQANLMMGLSGAITLNQIAKIVRHFVEMIKKTKNLQLAMILQMQLPMIEKISKSMLKGTEALSNGWPIGDSIAPLIVSKMIGDSRVKRLDEETVFVKKRIKGKVVYIMKARGPGGRLGKLGRSTEKLMRAAKFKKIITIDAAAKLEGEKTGSVAEGVGVAIGGIGVDRSYIENIAVDKNIPLDSVVVKMSQEEAIEPMKREILYSIPKVIKIIEKNVSTSQSPILLVGVGNTSGIGDNNEAANKAENELKKILALLHKREEQEKKQKKWYNFFGS